MADPVNYSIGWICAISTEYVVAQAFLDKDIGFRTEYLEETAKTILLGTIAGHNVVIAVLPNGKYGTASAAVVATYLLRSFPNIRIGLMVGIAGGVPSAKHEIRLGDIVVSSSFQGQCVVVQYDFGKAIQGKSFQLTRFLNQPPMILQTAVSGLSSLYEIKGHNLHEAVCDVLEQNFRLRGKYQQPGLSTDRLYHSNIVHPSSDNPAAEFAVAYGDKPPMLVSRKSRTDDEDNPMIHSNDYSSQQNDFIASHQEGSGERMLNSSQFQQWINQETTILFCPGIPGAGKCSQCEDTKRGLRL